MTDSPAPVCVARRTYRKLGREYLAEQEKTQGWSFLGGRGLGGGEFNSNIMHICLKLCLCCRYPGPKFCFSLFLSVSEYVLTDWAERGLCSLSFPGILLHLIFAPANTKAFLFLTIPGNVCTKSKLEILKFLKNRNNWKWLSHA